MCANCNMYEGTCGQQKQTGYHRKSSEMIYYRVELQPVLYGKHWAQADFILSMSAGPLDKISSSDSECTDICEPAWFLFFSITWTRPLILQCTNYTLCPQQSNTGSRQHLSKVNKYVCYCSCNQKHNS